MYSSLIEEGRGVRNSTPNIHASNPSSVFVHTSMKYAIVEAISTSKRTLEI